MNTDEEKLNQITEAIIGHAYTVSNALGCGFLEKVYENSLVHLLRKAGVKVAQQVEMDVHFDGVIVGHYVADIVVEDVVLVELKAAKALDGSHTAQCLNYLKATRKPLCLLINFGQPKVEVKRLRL